MKNKEPGMDLIVKTVSRLTAGLIMAYGVYIVLEGHTGPGGGFAGGVIIALSFVHLMLAFGKEVVLKKLNENKGLIFTCLGALAFLFFRQPNAFGAGRIALCDAAIAVMVGAGLFTVFLALVLLIGERGVRK